MVGRERDSTDDETRVVEDARVLNTREEEVRAVELFK